MGILFNDLVFGPLKSRRLGISLGVNLMPKAGKLCSFNCIYCECGWNDAERDQHLTRPTAEAIESALENKLKELKGTAFEPQSITFSGNGEPTLHPQFPEIIDSVIQLRDTYCPKAVISVLTNGTTIGNEKVFNALKKIENNIIKLDGGTQDCIEAINLPNFKFDLDHYIEQLKRFEGALTIQTLFLRGEHNGKTIDNTTEAEVTLWLEHLKAIRPKRVMMYVIERATPEENLEKLSKAELEAIAERVKPLGIETEIFA
ncbi:MAG: radical SAM protein [Bacteroidales bacterium]|nr:radical SAM protein [Bacteroidales bacterium]